MEKIQLEEWALSAPTLTVKIADLSRILGRSQQTVQNQMYRAPGKIPPWVQSSLPRIWHIDTVNAWLADKSKPIQAQVKPQLEVRRRRGRPSKAAGLMKGDVA